MEHDLLGTTIVITTLVVLTLIFFYFLFEDEKYEKEQNEHKSDSNKLEPSYIKPQFKPLTDEQIKDIHDKGKITPKEMVKEWEGMDLCAPGDAIGSAAWRCEKFHYNCHDCLVDYVNEHNTFFIRQGIYTFSLKIAVLLRNKSTTKE